MSVNLSGAETVALVVGLPSALAGLTALFAAVANRRGAAHKERLELSQAKREGDKGDDEQLRKDLNDAWAHNRELTKALGESEQARLSEVSAHREAVSRDQETRHELRSIARSALARIVEHNEEADEAGQIRCEDLRTRLRALYPVATYSD